MNTLIGTKFGTLEYSEKDVLSLVGGLIGFPNLSSFLVLPHRPDSPFQWLQSVDEPGLSFLTVDPFVYFKDYDPSISFEDADSIGMTEATERSALTTASIPGGQIELMTINLAAPIVINIEAKRGKQVVLEGDAYTIKHRVFQDSSVEDAKQAA